jgi:hypothetical protein
MGLENVQAVYEDVLVLDIIDYLLALDQSCEEDDLEHFLWAASCLIEVPNAVHNGVFNGVYQRIRIADNGLMIVEEKKIVFKQID